MNVVMEKETTYSTDDIQNRDPVTGNPRFNTRVIAAMEEARAMMRGEIPSRRYKFHEFFVCLYAARRNFYLQACMGNIF